jgi:ATP-dependent DNA ligase
LVPTGPEWIHEVKYDGYRGRVVRDGKVVKLYSKSGLDWSWRFPFIVETALKMRQTQFVIDGEICVLDVRGISDFSALHSNQHNDEAQFYAFDIVATPAGRAAARAQGPARQAAEGPAAGHLRRSVRAW